MYNLNRIINFVKQNKKHNLKSTEYTNVHEKKDEHQQQSCYTSCTSETSANKTKKFIFIKKRNRIQSHNIKTSASLHIISDSNDKALLNKLPNSLTLNDIQQEITTSLSTSITSSTSKTLSEAETSLYKNEEFFRNIQIQQNSSITSEIYTLEQMYNDNNIYSELHDMYNDFLETQANAEIRVVHNNLLNNYSTIMNNNDINGYDQEGSGTDSCSSCSSSCYSSESEDDENQKPAKGQIISKSQMSLNKSITSNVSNMSKLKSILVKKSTSQNLHYQEDDDKSISDYFGESISIKKLDEKIRFKLAALKLIAVKLNISMPAHLSMVETLYDLKMNHLKQETKQSLKHFDNKVKQDQLEKSNNLNKFLNTTTKLLKSYGLRRRAKSVETKINNDDTNKKASSIKKNDENNHNNATALKHKNYYSHERDNLERKYENQMRLIQFEILNSINAIELQFQEIRRNRSHMIEHQEHGRQNCKHACCTSVKTCNYSNHDEQSNSNVKPSKVHYSTQVSLQKRIQNRLKKKKQQLNMIKFLSSSSRESLVDVGISSNNNYNGGIKLIDSTDIHKYRNPNSIETMV